MLHDDVREARIAARLTQSEVARLAGVARQQVRDLEGGENITFTTFRKIASVLPNLKRVTLGGVVVATGNADLEEARRAALDLLDAAKRLVSALGSSAAAEQRLSSALPPAGAVRYQSESARKTAEELEPLIDESEIPDEKGDS